MRLAVLAAVALATLAHFGIQHATRDHGTAPDVHGPLQSVSFAPFGPNQWPDKGDQANADQIRADLKVLAPHVRAVRTYASTGGQEQVARIASEFGVKVTVGAWIDEDLSRNEREIRNALAQARDNRNVNGIVVGNESILRAEVTVPELIRYIERVKRQTNVPVTTGETWDVWIKYPELADAVDFIAAHVLPYWEGIPTGNVVDQTVVIYDKLRKAFPGKRIVIAEFGWPSSGYNLHGSDPGRLEQATILRDFLHRAHRIGMEYNLIEATDQPWKVFEGSVGPYWGLFNANRELKFPLTGPLVDPLEQPVQRVALIVGLLLCLPLFAMGALGFVQAGVLAVAAHAVGAWASTVLEFWMGNYFVWGAAFALGLGVVLLVPLVMIALARIDEIARIAFGRAPKRLLPAAGLAPLAHEPKVSIHIPAYKEQPEMLKATLDSVARLDYRNFECIVIINNTPDPAYWAPIEDHCRRLGERFKFLNEPRVEGFKAGALRIALAHTAPDAEIIGILDADYRVERSWLADLVPAFADPKVGLVQAPQEHLDEDRSVMHFAMNGENAGFFDIGMVQRNEDNAIITHGTMCLIRRAAMEEAGGWSSDTICEDTDLGLTILERGWTQHYTARRYGQGLLPDTFEAYRKQRHRWAYGGTQIVRKHWRRMFGGETALTGGQKRTFAVGWINWLGAETLGVLVAILNLIWVPVVAIVKIAIPDTVLTLPIIAAFLVTLLHFAALYKLRVKRGLGQTLGAAIASMSLQFTVAKAVSDGLIKEHLPFSRTAKGGAAAARDRFPAFWETILGLALIAGALLVYMTNYHQIREVHIFALVLVVQSLPFLAATAIALLERSKANDFAVWATARHRLLARIPGRKPAALPQPTPTGLQPAE